MDAAHFVYGAFLSTLWCFARLYIPTPCGRQRFNVLGALNAVSHQMITVTNTAYINAWSVVDLLRKIRAATPTGPITVILDNARYQKCHLVQCAAAMESIELMYLPTYSPNLNLIERAWKFIKKKSLNSRTHTDFTSFCNAINGCIVGFDGEHKKELDTLMTWNFQAF